MISGGSFYLYEFPTAAKSIDQMAIKRKFKGEKDDSQSFQLIFADALNPPVKPQAFNWIFTPWFIDIVPADIKYTLTMINALLPLDGYWIQFGPIAFEKNQPELCYSPEEFHQIIKKSGFEVTHETFKRIPYLESPANFHSRQVEVAVMVCKKIEEKEKPKFFQFTPQWLTDRTIPVPFTDEIKSSGSLHQISAKVLSWIDGHRNIDQIADEFAKEYKTSKEHAIGSISHFLLQTFQMTQQPPQTSYI